jgi:hypothetical protein
MPRRKLFVIRNVFPYAVPLYVFEVFAILFKACQEKNGKKNGQIEGLAVKAGWRGNYENFFQTVVSRYFEGLRLGREDY